MNARPVGWLGDSITKGLARHPDAAFAVLVSRHFGTAALNAGQNGASLPDLVPGPALSRLINSPCEWVVISHTGTNDRSKGVAPALYLDLYRSALRDLIAAGKRPFVVVGATATDPAFHDKPEGWMRQRLEPYSDMARKAAAEFYAPVCDAEAALEAEFAAGRPDVLCRRGDLCPAGVNPLRWRLYLASKGDLRAKDRCRVSDDSEDHLHANDPDRRFFYNQHPNRNGHRVIANAILASMAKHGLTPSPALG